MRSLIINSLIIVSIIVISACGGDKPDDQRHEPVHVFRVPSEYPSINIAVHNSVSGDTILISPGTYTENNITVDRSIIITSEWKTTGDTSKIRKTVIDAQGQILFNLTKPGTEISGLKIINGDHTLNITSSVTVKYCQFIDNLDALSFESGGGGYAGYNTMVNDKDDGIDLDIGEDKRNIGSDIIIENNSITGSHDDGIEIRLYTAPNQNIIYTIRNNTITASRNAAVQLISYDVYTGKKFIIDHNIFRNCMTGLGCMGGSNTEEDLSGTSLMDELVAFYNNTLIGNQMGATGGNKVIAFNNLVVNNTLGGFKKFGAYSVIKNNLFYNNGAPDMTEVSETALTEGNIFSLDPLINTTTYSPLQNSPCINAGVKKMAIDAYSDLEVPAELISGSLPDIGAIEFR